MGDTGLKEALGWENDKHPFTLEIVTDVVVGHKKLYNDLRDRITKNKRMVLVTGPYGVGKSFTLTYLRDNPPEDTVFVYLTGDYTREEVIKNIVVTIHNLEPFVTQKRFFGLVKERVRANAPEITENMLSEYVNKKLGGKRLVFMWDDIQRVKNADLVGLCVVLLEHTRSNIILCGLKEGVGWLENEVSFLNRGMDTLGPEPLSVVELKELIQKRVEWVGGEGFGPFTEEAVGYLATRFAGARDLLNTCNDVFLELEDEYRKTGVVPLADMSYIEDLLKERLEQSSNNPSISEKEDIRKKLSKLELRIFEVLLNNEAKTSPQLVEELKKDRGTIAKTIDRMMAKHPGVIILEKVEGKRRPENSYRLVQDVRRLYASR
ncbi:MAG: ATP-binding protein [Candidatus Altiarchaeota archaeon]|nr:ATP-binding protein [Candidatus Altiarchaeota archaeon]